MLKLAKYQPISGQPVGFNVSCECATKVISYDLMASYNMYNTNTNKWRNRKFWIFLFIVCEVARNFCSCTQNLSSHGIMQIMQIWYVAYLTMKWKAYVLALF